MTPIDDIVLVSPVMGTTAIELLDPRSSLRGKVIAVGPGRVTSEGVLIEPEIRPGDMVHLAPGRSIEAVFGERRVWVTREREILAVEA